MNPESTPHRRDHSSRAAELESAIGTLEHTADELLRILGPETEEPDLGLHWRCFPGLYRNPISIGEQFVLPEPDQDLPLSDLLVRIGQGIGQIDIIVGGVEPHHRIYQVQGCGPSGRVCLCDSALGILCSGPEFHQLLSCIMEVEAALASTLADLRKWDQNAFDDRF